MNSLYNTPKYKYLGIPYSDIINNQSYKRLLEFSLYLHGTSNEIKTIKTISLLINQLINTVENGPEIEKMMKTIGWDNKTKTLPNVNYSDLRKILLNDIQNLAIKNNPEEKDIITSFNYIKINNWNGMLLNSDPKRTYGYKIPIVFPNKSFDELNEIHDIIEQEGDTEKTDIIKSLFKRFCIDDEGNINKKMTHDDFILNIVAEPSFEREVNCFKEIEINEENFMKILEYNRLKYIKKFLPEETNVNNVIEKRLKTFIKI